MRALGLDLGQKRVGVAVSDVLAHRDADRGLVVWVIAPENTGRSPNWSRSGRPRSWLACPATWTVPPTYGQAGAAEAKALGDTLSVPVVLYDERLTTVLERALMDQNMNTQDCCHVVDKVAASVMLQSWLDAGMPQDGRGSGRGTTRERSAASEEETVARHLPHRSGR